MKLITTANAKTVKGEKAGFLTGVLYMAPAAIGGPNVCPASSAGCRAACLYTAGRGAFSNVQEARISRKRFFFEDRAAFMRQIYEEASKLHERALKLSMKPAIRLNGTSDIPFERVPFKLNRRAGTIFDHLPQIQWYDYTKRDIGQRLPHCPANYDLTFSLDEENEAQAFEALAGYGVRVAAVFETVPWRHKLAGQCFDVIDGDATDLRFLDPAGVIVGLNAKGKAKHDATGFVIRERELLK